MGQIYLRLDSRTADQNGVVQFPLSGLPTGKRARALNLDTVIAYTKATADVLSADAFPLWYASVRVGTYVTATGLLLRRLLQRMLGRDAAIGADIAAGPTSGNARFQLVVPFKDLRQSGSDDGSMPCDLLRGESLIITTAPANVHGVGSLAAAANGFNISLSAELVEEVHVPEVNQIGYMDPGGQTFELAAGIYKDLFLTKGNTTGTFSETDVSTVYLEGDGGVFLGNMSHGQMVQQFNTHAVRDTACELVIGAAREFPIIWMDQSGKAHLTKQVAVESRARCQLQGTYATPRVNYWRTVLKDENYIKSLSAAVGANGQYEPQTASKQLPRSLELSANQGSLTKKARLILGGLPGKARDTASPNNA